MISFREVIERFCRKRMMRRMPWVVPDVRKWMRMDLRELGRHLQKLLSSRPQDYSLAQMRDVSQWPLHVTIAFLCAVFVLTLAIAGAWLWHDAMARGEIATQESEMLQARYLQFATRVKQEPIYTAQIAEIEGQFGTMLDMIPAELEMVQVLNQINRAARDSGLRLELFRPGAEEPGDIYAILPVDIRLVGSYHGVGRFLEAVAHMTHLLTVDVVLEPSSTMAGQVVLITRVKAYRAQTLAKPDKPNNPMAKS